MGERLLCVEDDKDIGQLLQATLSEAGYDVDWVMDGHKALSRWQKASLVLLDIMLPGLDGLSVCREIRQQDAGLPLIILTAMAGTRDVVRGLELGADDYITKPFDTAELLARVQALLRRSNQAAVSESREPPIVIADLRIDLVKHEVLLAGEPIPLTAKEFALLTLFARHPGRSFTRGELLDRVWGEDFAGFDHTVNTHINRLRGKIETDPAKPHFIQTVWGVGYRFVDAA